MPLRVSAVSFADVRGIRHTVEVQAESLFEAAILGVRTFRGDPWIEHVGPAIRHLQKQEGVTDFRMALFVARPNVSCRF